MSENTENNSGEQPEEGKKKKGVRTKRMVKLGTQTDLAAYLREQAVWHKLMSDRLPDFQAFDPALDAAFATQWRQDIDSLTAHPTDETMVDLLANATQEVMEAYRAAATLADDLEYFVRHAFADDERKLDEFGFRLLHSVSHTTSLRFTLFGYTMAYIANEYLPQLLAAGLPATWATDFETAIANCGDAEIRQEVAKRHRIKATTYRITLANRLYATWARINKAAKVIYRAQPETAKLWERG
jgi:hypothetical protein